MADEDPEFEEWVARSTAGKPPERAAEIRADLLRGRRAVTLAGELQDADPRLGLAGAIAMANDRLSMEVADEWLWQHREEDPMRALAYVGSYSRMDWLVRKIEAGVFSRERVYEHLAELWRGSDPDDTDPRFLKLWQDAVLHFGHTIVDKGSWTRRKVFRVWRGQDADARFGIAWTTDVKIARRYAAGMGTRQSDRNGIVLEARVHPTYVLGVLRARGESEIVVDPETFQDGPEVIGQWVTTPV